MDAKKLLKQLKDSKASLEAYKSKRLGASSGSTIDAASEFKACAKYGVKSLNDLIRVNTSDRRFKAMSHDDREAVKALKEAVDVTLMTAQIFKLAPQETKAYAELVEPALKALGIVSGDAGANWVPTAISESYIDEYNLDRKITGLFAEIKMPTSPYEYPVLSNGAIATKLGQNAKKATPDQFSSSKITFTATKLSNQYELPEELTEDSAVDVMKVIRQELIEGMEKALEIAILEGDTAGTHQHTNTQIPGASGAPAADSCERVFDGLRKRALAASQTVDCGAVAVSETKLAELKQKLGKFGVNPAELVLICGVKGYNQLLQLDDVRTMEQLGPNATVLKGQLASYEGVPVVVSEWLREDTAAAGVNGASGNTKASMLLVNRKRFFVGLRRAVQVKVEQFRTQYDVTDMVTFARYAFQGVPQGSGETSVALLYNIA